MVQKVAVGGSLLSVNQDLRQKKSLKSSKHGFQDYSEHQFNQQMVGKGEIVGERKRLKEIAYTRGFKMPRPGSGTCGFSTHIALSRTQLYGITQLQRKLGNVVSKGARRKRKGFVEHLVNCCTNAI